MDRFTDLPALLLDAKKDVLAWNALATALLGDFSALPPAERNVAWQRFVAPRSPARAGSRIAAWAGERERLDRALVSDLRAAAARYPDDPGLLRLVRELRARSTEFAQLWELRELNERHSDRKRVHHPDLGDIDLDCDTLLVHGDDQVLLVYSAHPAPPRRGAGAAAGAGLQDLRAPTRDRRQRSS